MMVPGRLHLASDRQARAARRRIGQNLHSDKYTCGTAAVAVLLVRKDGIWMFRAGLY